ncbi:rRNA methyltransferase 2, mitochondrial [Lampetra fluviatilis]
MNSRDPETATSGGEACRLRNEAMAHGFPVCLPRRVESLCRAHGALRGPTPRRALHAPSSAPRARSGAAQIWLQRQRRDPFVRRAQELGLRCRSGFKLAHMDEQLRWLQPGRAVLDLGAAPGAWSQEAARRVNATGVLLPGAPRGFVLGLDLLPVEPLDGVSFLGGTDVRAADTETKVRALLPGGAAHVVLSDLAPRASGVRALDHEQSLVLCWAALALAIVILRPGGHFLCKLWDGASSEELRGRLRATFREVRALKPPASRRDSAEFYLAASGLRAPRRP